MTRTVLPAGLFILLLACPSDAALRSEPDEDYPHQSRTAEGQKPTPRPQGPFRKIGGKITPGMKLFLVTDKRYIGEVVEWRASHPFPDGKPREGVKVKLAEGRLVWLPADTVRRIYLTK